MRNDAIAKVVLLCVVIFFCVCALAWVYFLGSLSDGSMFAVVLSLLPIGGCWLIHLLIVRSQVEVKGCLFALVVTSLAAIPLFLQPWTPESQFKSHVRSQMGRSVEEAQRSMGKYKGGKVVPLTEAYVGIDVPAFNATHATEYRQGYWHGWLYVRDSKVVGTTLTWD